MAPLRIHHLYKGKSVVFDRETERVVVGRPKKNVEVELDLTPDDSVSRPHACIWVAHGKYWIEDLGRTHGTLVSGEQIRGKVKRLLRADDTIKVGRTILRVEMPDRVSGSATATL